MNMQVLPNSEKRFLRYDFTAVEVVDLSMELANKTQLLSSTEAEKTAVSSQYKSKIDGLKSELGNLSNKVSSGFEMRYVDCEVKYHLPEQGKKTITRKDTDERLVEKMSTDEWNLFNQEE